MCIRDRDGGDQRSYRPRTNYNREGGEQRPYTPRPRFNNSEEGGCLLYTSASVDGEQIYRGSGYAMNMPYQNWLGELCGWAFLLWSHSLLSLIHI